MKALASQPNMCSSCFNQAKMPPRTTKIFNILQRLEIQKERVFWKCITIFCKNSKSSLISLKTSLYSLVISELNKLICPYNLLISLDLSEISRLKNNSTDFIHSYLNYTQQAFNLLKTFLTD